MASFLSDSDPASVCESLLPKDEKGYFELAANQTADEISKCSKKFEEYAVDTCIEITAGLQIVQTMLRQKLQSEARQIEEVIKSCEDMCKDIKKESIDDARARFRCLADRLHELRESLAQAGCIEAASESSVDQMETNVEASSESNVDQISESSVHHMETNIEATSEDQMETSIQGSTTFASPIRTQAVCLPTQVSVD